MRHATDPVCGKQVDQSKASVEAGISWHAGVMHYFCSMQCKLEFDRNPSAYLRTTPAEQGVDDSKQQPNAATR